MTAKLVLDTRYERKDKCFPVAIRVRSGNQLKHITTGYLVPEKAWNNTEVKKNYPDADTINADIAKQLAAVRSKLIRAKSEGLADLNVILNGRREKPLLFSDYLEARARQYDEEKKIKHAKKVRQWLTDIRSSYGSNDVPFALSADDMRKLNIYLKKRGNALNTIHDKFAKLGQLFNAALKERKTDAENEFGRFKAPKEPVHKEKLTKEEITAMENVVLPAGIMNDCRNLFLLSYYCKGMRFEDCLRFRRENIKDGRVIFEEARKGHKRITVKLHGKLQKLIEPYLHTKTPYLFPLLKTLLQVDDTGVGTEAAERERISKVEPQNTIVNRHLKVIAAAAGIDKSFGFHSSRHSVAYNLKKEGVNINVIKDVLAHSDTKMTEQYLKSLDDEDIDKELDKLYE